MPRQSPRLAKKRSAGVSRRVGAKRQRRSDVVVDDVSSREPRPINVSDVTATSEASMAIPDALIDRIVDAVHHRLSNNSHTNLPNDTTSSPPTALSGVVEQPVTAVGPIAAQGELATPFVSVGFSIDARVSEKTRQKIWNNEYIDLGALLTTPTNQGRYQLSLNKVDAGVVPSLVLEPAEKPQKIVTIDRWLTAFNVYVGVYTMRFPTEAPALVKYISIIRDLAERGHNWHFYDENFRFLRQSHVLSMPWGSIHSELWLRSHVTSISNGAATPSRFSSQRTRFSDPIPAGFCYRFHRGNNCVAPNCRFKHVCYRCSGDHRASACNFRASKNNTGDRQPQSSKPNTNQSKAANSGPSR